MRNFICVAFLLAVVFFAACHKQILADEAKSSRIPIPLQFKGEKDQQTRYSLQINFSPLTKATGKLAGIANSFPFNRLFRFIIRQTITNIDLDGNLHVTYALEGVSIGGASTDEAKLPLIEETLSSIKGKTLTFIMAPSGRVTNVSGLEGINDVNLQETIKAVLSRLHPRFPLAPVSEGKRWQYDEGFTSKFNSIMGMLTMENSVKTNYTLLGFEEKLGYKCAKIQSVAALTQSFPSDLLPLELPFKATAAGNGKGNGTIYFAPQTGQLVSADFTIIQQGNVTLSPKIQLSSNNGKSPGEFRQTITAELETNVRIDLEPSKQL